MCLHASVTTAPSVCYSASKISGAVSLSIYICLYQTTQCKVLTAVDKGDLFQPLTGVESGDDSIVELS